MESIAPKHCAVSIAVAACVAFFLATFLTKLTACSTMLVAFSIIQVFNWVNHLMVPRTKDAQPWTARSAKVVSSAMQMLGQSTSAQTFIVGLLAGILALVIRRVDQSMPIAFLPIGACVLGGLSHSGLLRFAEFCSKDSGACNGRVASADGHCHHLSKQFWPQVVVEEEERTETASILADVATFEMTMSLPFPLE